MAKELVISAAPHETRVAILEDGQLCEIYIEREKEFALVGSIYKGRVTRVLPGMQSAFVDIGLDSDAFLYVGDFLENLEDYDHVVTTVEGKVEKMEQQGGVVFTSPQQAEPAPDHTPLPEAAVESEASQPPQPASEQPSAAPVYSQSQPPRFQQPAQQQPPASFNRAPSSVGGRDRGQGRPGQNQGRDRDQGGNRREGGGRWRRGRGNDRRQGRDLPQSKYASPRPFAPRPYEPPSNEPETDLEPIILPGESLAKYKNRAPAVSPHLPPEPPSENAVPALHDTKIAPPKTHTETQQSDASAANLAHSPAEHTSPESSYADAEVFSAYQPMPEEPPLTVFGAQHHADEHETSLHESALHERFEQERSGTGADLSDEEVSSLAEQLAEARQEETTAEADADTNLGVLDEDRAIPPETAAETDEFIAEAETEEHETAEREPEDSDIADRETEGHELGGNESAGFSGTEAAGQDAAGAAPGNEAGPESGETHPPLIPGAEPRPMIARMSDPQRARFQRPMRRGNRQRGNRNVPHHDHRPQPQRRPQLISEMLKAGQEIIVQIAKEPLGKKGARITSHVALPGRFLVYMPTVNHIGVSRRIASADERSRLRRLVTESKGTFPGGFIVRTAAEGAPDDEIRSDVEFLGRTWDKIRTQAEPRKSPALLHRDLNLVERILRDYVSNDYSAIWIDNEDEFSKVVDFVSRFQPKLVSRVKLYTKPAPIFEEFGIQQELDKALRPKVWLKSGGYIVINHTEALVAIDVNTGKYVGRGSTRLEDTIVKTNLEAVKEIIRQIRLRDLGGIIVLDFIDMEERRNREKVMGALEAALRADRAPSKALAFNEFGLVAITRKRTKQALERVLCQPCPYCTGSGMVKSVPTICYEIQAEARKMSVDLDASSITLRVHPEIAKALKTREAVLVEELEQATRKSVIIQADPTLHWEQYDIY